MTPNKFSGDQTSKLQEEGFEVLYLNHAMSILSGEFPSELNQLTDVLKDLKLPITEIIGSGGGETKFTQRLRHALDQLGWKKHNFIIEKSIDNVKRESISHEVDHVKTVVDVGTIGCEIEWNNKDPFFDRDLENYKRLHAEGAISVGVVITRGSSLQSDMRKMVMRFADAHEIGSFADLEAVGVVPTPKQKASIDKRVKRKMEPISFREAWVDNFVSNKFGAATTHWSKLYDRVKRGVGNPCPLLLIGLPASIVVFDNAIVDQLDDE